MRPCGQSASACGRGAPAGRCQLRPKASLTKPAPIASGRGRYQVCGACGRCAPASETLGDLWRLRKAFRWLLKHDDQGPMDIYVHRPLIVALPRVENAFHPSWRALAGMRASQPGRACVAAGLYDKGDPSTPGASRPALRMTRAPRFAPCAQDDKGAALRALRSG